MSAPKLEDLPDDLRELLNRAQQFTALTTMWRSGVFPQHTSTDVQNGELFLASAAQHYQSEVAKHPRFAEFWPDEAQKIEARTRQAHMRAQAGLPELLAPDGRPLTSKPNLILLREAN